MWEAVVDFAKILSHPILPLRCTMITTIVASQAVDTYSLITGLVKNFFNLKEEQLSDCYAELPADFWVTDNGTLVFLSNTKRKIWRYKNFIQTAKESLEDASSVSASSVSASSVSASSVSGTSPQ